ncbi:unnamed protein product [Cutaneotrichosporon oleaginosum]
MPERDYRGNTEPEGSKDFWDGETIQIHNDEGKVIAVVPLEFARQGGCSTWQELGEVMSYLFPNHQDVPLLWKKDSQLLPAEDHVEAGPVLLFPSKVVTPSVFAPQSLQRAPSTASGSSSRTSQRSEASDSSAQHKFRDRVLNRDGRKCVVTNVVEHIEAAHVIPKSDPQGYKYALGDIVTTLYHTSFGITLWCPIRRMFDADEVAFLPRIEADGTLTLVFHIFKLPVGDPTTNFIVQGLRRLHGKMVSYPSTTLAAPDVKLLRLQYSRVLYRRMVVWGLMEASRTGLDA